MGFVHVVGRGLGCQGGEEEQKQLVQCLSWSQGRLWLDIAALQWQEPAEHSLSQWLHHPVFGVLWISLHIGGEITKSWSRS